MYRAYIKDALDLSGKTKNLIPIKSGSVRTDRLTSANSSFETFYVPSNINLGDLFILLNDKGKIMYYGIITSLKDKEIKTSQITSIFKGSFNYSYVNTLQSLNHIEQAITSLLNNYKAGNFYGSSYVDSLIATKLNMASSYVNSTSGKLATDKDEEGNDLNTIKDIEAYLYEIYKTYGICVDFTFPIGEVQPSFKVWKPNYSYLKVSDGFECVSSITPTSSMQTTNKLIIFSADKVYRDTYILTSSGIVAHPSATIGRPVQVNTKVVYSDDGINDIVKTNLSETLYNHKIVFNVVIDNVMLNIDNLVLDVPLKIYKENSYFDTLITGREFSFNNDSISNLTITCGLVRTSLTDKLKMGYAK